MRYLASGCPIRRELFGDHAMVEMRPCDGGELNIQVIADTLQHRRHELQTYIRDDIS